MAEKNSNSTKNTKAKTTTASTKTTQASTKTAKTSTKTAKTSTKTAKTSTKAAETSTETTQTSMSAFKAKAAEIAKTKNFRIAAISGLSVILVLVLCLALGFGLKSCTGMRGILRKNAVGVNSYSQTTTVGYSAETLGTVERYKPVSEVRDERDMFSLGITVADNARYPVYGYTMNSVVGADPDGSKAAARTSLINESSYLTATGTANAGGGGYTWMDENGYLYSGTRSESTPACYSNGKQRQLYQHTASIGLYLGDVSDKEPGIIKQVTLRPRGYSSYSVTGVYACAGEVIKIEISDEDMTATGGIIIHIGQALYNGQANNIWTTKGQMQRIPHLLNTMAVNKNTAYFDEGTQMWTAYVGSFIGGPLYVRNTTSTVTVKISGGVAYRHFILGYTTPEEFAEVSKSTAPYFDLEVWDRGVLHSGPVTYANSFSYNDLYKAAILWEKVAIVANSNGEGKDYYQGIVFLYDPFVAAGAAVAFPGRASVNCPMGWMPSSLNYDSIVTSGSWGNFHEFHHNFQNFGVGYTGEVTNNALTLVDYSLFTNISSARQISSFGGAGLSGWNCYTSATWALNRVKTGAIGSTNGLAVYATLLHNFGQDAFLNTRGYTGSNYLNRWATVTHQDFSYFATQIRNYDSTLNPSATDYPLFVPVSSVYQTGRSYNYDGEIRYIETMQPYVIPYGKEFTVDLRAYSAPGDYYDNGSIIIGTGFEFKIKEVKADGINGTFAPTDTEGVYTFMPNSELRSGKIYVTLEIYNSADKSRVWNGHELQDVDLVIEFQQSHEWNKAVLERTVYTYSADNMFTDAQTAFESNFGTPTSTLKVDHSNPVQNANTDIWLYPDTEANHTAHPDVPDYYFVSDNRIDVIDGKLYFKEDGKYRIYLRGRLNCALYFSLDGKNYTLGAAIKKTEAFSNSDKFQTTDENTYFDIEFDEGKCNVWIYVDGGKELKLENSGDNWLYIKEVLIVQSSPMVSYIGVGFAQWTVPLYTTVTKYYDSNGKEVTAESEDIARTETLYFDSTGKQVTAEQASNVDPIAPTAASYATAYRNDYEFKAEFESDYFLLRTYGYDYIDNITVPNDEITVTETNYTATGWGSGMPITNLTDGVLNTYIHTSWQVSENNPLNLTFDLGGERTINRITFYCRNNNGMLESPKAFIVEGSLDGETWFNVATFTDAPRNGHYVIVDFEDATMNYCRITISQTHQGNGTYYLVLGEISFTHSTEYLGATMYSPDDEMFTYKGKWKVESCTANFGHVFVGKKATMEFEFEGTMFGILASKDYGQNYQVYVDGNLVTSGAVKDDDGAYSLVFVTPELEEGTHSVVVYFPKEGNIDSIVVW